MTSVKFVLLEIVQLLAWRLNEQECEAHLKLTRHQDQKGHMRNRVFPNRSQKQKYSVKEMQFQNNVVKNSPARIRAHYLIIQICRKYILTKLLKYTSNTPHNLK